MGRWLDSGQVGGGMGGRVGDYNITNGSNRLAEDELVSWGQVRQH